MPRPSPQATRAAPLPFPAPALALAVRHPRLVVPRSALTRLFAVLAPATPLLSPRPASAAPTAGELSLVFLTDRELAALHADFLDDPSPTDVITFAGDPAAGTAGEICVSVDTAAREARARRADFATELTLYLVHGWLHLLGHDDRQPGPKRRMRAAERRALRRLRQHDAVPCFRLRASRGGGTTA